MAAVVCLPLAAGLLIRTPADLDPEAAGATEAFDIEQIERALEDMEMLHVLGRDLREEGRGPRSL